VSYRFLLDENIPRRIYRALKERGYYVEYVPKGVDDETVINIARNRNLILITRDSDFADEIMYPPGSHPGIIVLRVHPALPKLLAEKLLETLDKVKNIERKLIIVYNDRVEIIG
jgi:predicted nuclease of predicted toxin-antitoxin system